MKRRFLSEAELLEKRDEIIEQYNSTTPKSKSVAVLTKRQRKVLGIGRDQGKAILYNARISARKVKIVLDLIRGKSLAEAVAIVRFTPKAASEIIYKLLKSAEANAVNNFELDSEKLYVAECFANQELLQEAAESESTREQATSLLY